MAIKINTGSGEVNRISVGDGFEFFPAGSPKTNGEPRTEAFAKLEKKCVKTLEDEGGNEITHVMVSNTTLPLKKFVAYGDIALKMNEQWNKGYKKFDILQITPRNSSFKGDSGDVLQADGRIDAYKTVGKAQAPQG